MASHSMGWNGRRQPLCDCCDSLTAYSVEVQMVKGSQLTAPNAPTALLGSSEEYPIELHSSLPAAAPGLSASLAGTVALVLLLPFPTTAG